MMTGTINISDHLVIRGYIFRLFSFHLKMGKNHYFLLERFVFTGPTKGE